MTILRVTGSALVLAASVFALAACQAQVHSVPAKTARVAPAVLVAAAPPARTATTALRTAPVLTPPAPIDVLPVISDDVDGGGDDGGGGLG
jgi:hypothetical protein